MGKPQAVPEVIWQEPPVATKNSRKGNGKYALIELSLRANPGQWALVQESEKSVGGLPRFAGPDFERAYRTVREGIRTFNRYYVRFVGRK